MYHSCFFKHVVLACATFLLLLLSSCSYKPNTAEYRAQYLHLQNQHPKRGTPTYSDYYLVLLVSARHLDYSNGKNMLRTLVKHPDDGSKNGDVGHAWIILRGMVDEHNFVLEGGHSGELGRCQPRYFDGIMDYVESGEPDPIKYLWESQKDGFFQKGSGGHRPTYAIKVNLTKEQFLSILVYVDPQHYDYSNYALTGNQCSSFVADVAKIAGLDLDCEITIPIPQYLTFRNASIQLWKDSVYSELTVSSPDILERSMMRAVDEGCAEVVSEIAAYIRAF